MMKCDGWVSSALFTFTFMLSFNYVGLRRAYSVAYGCMVIAFRRLGRDCERALNSR